MYQSRNREFKSIKKLKLKNDIGKNPYWHYLFNVFVSIFVFAK